MGSFFNIEQKTCGDRWNTIGCERNRADAERMVEVLQASGERDLQIKEIPIPDDEGILLAALQKPCAFVNYNCNECGDFQVIHSFSKKNKRCQCGKKVKIKNIEAIGGHDGQNWRLVKNVPQEEMFCFWRKLKYKPKYES